MYPLDPSDRAILGCDTRLRELAAALAGDGVGADDLAQEVWLRLLQVHGAPVRRPAAWLRALLKNAARNLRRADARRRGRDGAVARPEQDPAPGPFDLAEYEERRAQLVAAVASLPPAQRAVLIARYWEGMEPADLARRTGASAAAVRQRLHRALQTLRTQLDARTGDRRAWLLPLLSAGRAPIAAANATGTVATTAGAIVLLAGFTMKKALTTGVCIAMLLGLGWIGVAPLIRDATRAPGSSVGLTAPLAPTAAPAVEAILMPSSFRSHGRRARRIRLAFVRRGGSCSGAAWWKRHRNGVCRTRHRGTLPGIGPNAPRARERECRDS